MGVRTEKLALYNKMLATQGEERYRLALEIMAGEMEFLVAQISSLSPTAESVAAVAGALRDVASIGHRALQ